MSTSVDEFKCWLGDLVHIDNRILSTLVEQLEIVGENSVDIGVAVHSALPRVSETTRQRITSHWRSTHQIINILNRKVEENDDWWETANEIELIRGLYVGSFATASNLEWLQNNGITHILNVTDTIPNSFPKLFVYKRISVFDVETSDLYAHFVESNQWIENALSSGGKVLIHCAAGVSRSVTMACAYLMHKYKFSAENALRIVSVCRTCASPNNGFRKQLLCFEERNK